MDKLKKLKSEILENKKSIQLKLENLLATIESGNAPKTITKRIIELENDLKEIVPYMKEMGRDRLRDLLHLIIKDITLKNHSLPMRNGR